MVDSRDDTSERSLTPGPADLDVSDVELMPVEQRLKDVRQEDDETLNAGAESDVLPAVSSATREEEHGQSRGTDVDDEWNDVEEVGPLTRYSFLLFICQNLMSADIDGRRRLRSPDTNMLVIASTRRSTLGDRSFPVAASRAWNGLPASVRAATSLVSFRKELKTVLFRRSFD